jgi:tetratricopeptide (TPR) repeat protein
MRGYDHLEHALKRFPDDPELLFMGVVAGAMRANPVWRRKPLAQTREPVPTDPERDAVLAGLSAFRSHASRGGEANLWMGLILLHQYDRPEDALTFFEVAARSPDSFVAYLAHYAAGRVHDADGRGSSAAGLYRQALKIQPGTQSAVLSLSALLFSTGDIEEAYQLLQPEAWQDAPPDPFQLYGFGDYRRFDHYMARLRAEVLR